MLLTGPFAMLSMPSFDFHLPPCTEGFLIHLSPLWQLPLWQLPLFPSVAQFPCVDWRSQNSYTTPALRAMASSAMELHLGVFCFIFVFLPTTHAETNAYKMRPQSLFFALRAAFHASNLHAQTAVHLHKSLLFCLREKTNTPIGAPCQDKDGAGSGISGLYLWFQCKLQNIIQCIQSI